MHLAWLDVAVAAFHKSNLASAGLQYAGCRNDELAPHRHLQRHIHEHPEFEPQSRVEKNNTYFGRSCVHVNLWVDEIHPATEGPPWEGIHGERYRTADLYLLEIVLEDLSLNPNGGEIGDGVEAHFRLEGNTGESIAFSDIAGNR